MIALGVLASSSLAYMLFGSVGIKGKPKPGGSATGGGPRVTTRSSAKKPKKD